MTKDGMYYVESDRFKALGWFRKRNEKPSPLDRGKSTESWGSFFWTEHNGKTTGSKCDADHRDGYVRSNLLKGFMVPEEFMM